MSKQSRYRALGMFGLALVLVLPNMAAADKDTKQDPEADQGISVDGPLSDDEANKWMTESKDGIVVEEYGTPPIAPADLRIGESRTIITEDAVTVYSRYNESTPITEKSVEEYKGTIEEYEASGLATGRLEVVDSSARAGESISCTTTEQVWSPWRNEETYGQYSVRGKGKKSWSEDCGYEYFFVYLEGLRWWAWSTQDSESCNGDGPKTCTVYPRDTCHSLHSDKYRDRFVGDDQYISPSVTLICTAW